jgi:hypothetical protein
VFSFINIGWSVYQGLKMATLQWINTVFYILPLLPTKVWVEIAWIIKIRLKQDLNI